MVKEGSEAAQGWKARKADRIGSGDGRLLVLGVVFGATALFVANGSWALPAALRGLIDHTSGPDRLLQIALLLNIALLFIGWSRYRDLVREVDERRDAEARARLLAETDPLTDCLNRRSIGPRGDQLVAQAHARGWSVLVAMIDLDSFKQINDTHGHRIGDLLLRETARRIESLLPPGSLLARCGGDEFACVVTFDPLLTDMIDTRVARLAARVAEPVLCEGTDVQTSISIGLVRCDPSASPESTEALLHMADIAMYQAKKRATERYCWFEPAMETELRLHGQLETGIRRGIPLGEFVPYFEKQIDLATGKLVGFEVLARWNSPTLGLVGPDIFIPIAEKAGLIADLSHSVIAQALAVARWWDPSLTLSVNISPVQMRDPWFAQGLLKLLVEANFPPNRLDIEITEGCLHENMAMVSSIFTSLKNQGISVSLDDFGTGYSSLSQLHALPFDRIKIDRGFVAELTSDPDRATIVESVASLGQGLGLPITAEGVESREALERLAAYGEIKAQGYYFGMPVPAEAVEQELAERNLLVRDDARLSVSEQPLTP